MSHSERHQDNRRQRAKQKAKECRIQRNALRNKSIDRSPAVDRSILIHDKPLTKSWWARMAERAWSLLSIFNWKDTRTAGEKIHGRGWLRRKQKEEARNL